MEKSGYITVIGCRKCGKCSSVCGAGAIERADGFARINQEKCNLCMQCIAVCPNGALRYLE